ncbi:MULTISPECIES: hypothetical protein [Nannocystis]|jgi:hypothetical protein|uniref:Lipoprotein n=1 Tax=Nannocystis radixulma TaxID=2995305 RepID=A0ABT5BJL2_9BACT|nr:MULTISPECIES: hypothetical protein [Nannocystis]MCY1063116.1 hypothetical protein [Nannocystis sp. SCPEA4]MDC0673878.1 hypothetical protein [Nannocystis radixulma]
MKIDLEKFLAATMLLATATTPACGSKDAKKVETKADTKTATPPPAAPQPTPAPAPVAAPPAAPEAAPPATPPAGADKPAAAKPDPGPEEEKPSW